MLEDEEGLYHAYSDDNIYEDILCMSLNVEKPQTGLIEDDHIQF